MAENQEPTRAELAVRIIERVKSLIPPTIIDEPLLTFYTEKLIQEIMDYCNITFLPEALEMAIIELMVKQIRATDENIDINNLPIAQLKRIKMDDTEYEFNFNTQDGIEQGTDYIFNAIMPRLFKYRRMRSL